MNACPADRFVGKRLMRGRCECESGGCWKRSARYQRRRRCLVELRDREARRRTDAAHKASAVLAAENDVVAFEKLDVVAMTRSAKGTAEEPGVNVAAKAGLNRAITAQAWGSVKAKTAYKTTVVEVDPRFTSQTCHECGHVDKASRRSQAEFRCTSCGHEANADVNAAKNIRARGLERIASEREPAGAQPVAGRGGDRDRRPDEPSTWLSDQTCREVCERLSGRPDAGERSQGGGCDLLLVPLSWGVRPRLPASHRRRGRPAGGEPSRRV